ncbi:undecaprenyldiphospho-muramoylpentapeptide beta-N-acetylglucosaminyltransferase [bacterium]|nr:undecaprenyldiphospho-muramoylpentapeptide beta-N-acetylglucosaminyltransferase [bacterium]
MRRIVFTGGGTGGHIIPNIALINKLKEKYPDISILYIGSKKGPESKMIPKINIAYKGISTGKLRRYFSFKNFTDLFRVPIGMAQAFSVLRAFKPQVVFSKGGYVSIPVMFAARLLKIPTILHESDITPGLANKVSAKKVSVLCLAHHESQRYFMKHKNKIVTGNPVRESVFQGNSEQAYKITGFSKDIPTILIMGGSQGAKHINEDISLAANELTQHYQIIHIAGHGKLQPALPILEEYRSRYKAYEYIDEQLPDFYQITDLVIARSGANTLAEIDALKIPAILIPIGSSASRGEQLLNAFAYQEKHDGTIVIEDELLTYKSLIHAISKILPWDKYKRIEKEIPKESQGVKNIIEVLDRYLGDACIAKDQKC